MKHDFLFELGVEELPSKSVKSLSENLLTSVVAQLEKLGINFDKAKAFATPRRLAFRLDGLQSTLPKQQTTKRGPASVSAFNDKGEPQPALLGFAKSCGVTIEQLILIETDKGSYYGYIQETDAVPVTQIMPELITAAIKALPIPKLMRWGIGEYEFIRPVHWIVMLSDDKLVPANLFGIDAGTHTRGHRFHAPESIEIPHANQYELLLNKHFVMADFEEREALIHQQILAIAQNNHASAEVPSDLLEEVTSIVEWPTALLVPFSEKFLSVPKEALIASMQQHQKCFALLDSTQKLLPYFITISNIESKNSQVVVDGNAKVMCARLSDAMFFYEQDKKTPLSSHIESTKKVVFQHKLGTLHDKTERMQALAQAINDAFVLDTKDIVRAISLSKCDLMTGMVGEFPELQGTMGYYYATNDKELPVVARSLMEYYWPRFSGDDLPSESLGRLLSIVDRVDTLVGIFGIGEKPSGVKDPFKLRRHALALIRLLLAHDTPISIQRLLNESAKTFASKINTESLKELNVFILDRLYAYYQSMNIDKPIVQSVLAVEQNNLKDIDARVRAIQVFAQTDASHDLVASAKRVNNILAKIDSTPSFSMDLLQTQEERELAMALSSWDDSLEKTDYVTQLNHLAELKTSIHNFFEHVMVMVDDTALKNNRIALVQKLQKTLNQVADIAYL